MALSSPWGTLCVENGRLSHRYRNRYWVYRIEYGYCCIGRYYEHHCRFSSC